MQEDSSHQIIGTNLVQSLTEIVKDELQQPKLLLMGVHICEKCTIFLVPHVQDGVKVQLTTSDNPKWLRIMRMHSDIDVISADDVARWSSIFQPHNTRLLIDANIIYGPLFFMVARVRPSDDFLVST
ncbi:hypothetical protein Fot_03340 [Forsythia ovata]|uniref:Uncharacterized protein n=1 Tax=Forsythia ovata TaxID=205694 RepID=A0ABD1X9F6_9LAMI